MKKIRRRARSASAGVALALVAVVAQFAMAPVAGASPSLQSTGSSFASVAIQQWVGQSSTLYGLNVNWQVSSSVIGLNNFGQNQVDFAASDIPYSAQQSTYYPSQPYQYLPDVAGGLSFMYNLDGNDGQQITNLQLNAALVGEIFLGEIKYWNDPRIAAANPQLNGDLPHQTVLPVYRSDASGENYLLSDYLLHRDAADFGAAQAAFQSPSAGQPSATWPTPGPGTHPNPAIYPGWGAGTLVGESGSDNAANYVSAVSSLGAITYVETAFAKEHNFPVANLLNASGAYVQPTSENVAVALEAAVLHPDLTQDLTNVYTNPLPTAYPLSAYSYFVTPCSPQLAAASHSNCASFTAPGVPATSPTSPLDPQKGQALGQFVGFLACAGQEKMASLGYSPLPPNLVQEDFDAIGRLNGGVQPPPVSAATCKNPYVDGEIPLPGEPQVPGQPGGGITTTTLGALATHSAGPGGSTSAGSSAGSSSGGSSTGSTSGSSQSELSAQLAAKGYTIVNGQIVRSLDSGSGPSKYLRADDVVAALGGIGTKQAAYIGWSLLILALIFGPPLFAMYLRRRATPASTGPDGAGSSDGTGSTDGAG